MNSRSFNEFFFYFLLGCTLYLPLTLNNYGFLWGPVVIVYLHPLSDGHLVLVRIVERGLFILHFTYLLEGVVCVLVSSFEVVLVIPQNAT